MCGMTNSPRDSGAAEVGEPLAQSGTHTKLWYVSAGDCDLKKYIYTENPGLHPLTLNLKVWDEGKESTAFFKIPR